MGLARRRRMGAQPRARPTRRIQVLGRHDARGRPGPVRLGPRHRRVGPGAGLRRPLLDDVWRERGFGDFWGYALVAEGAAEAMIEVELSPWDAAAPMLLVEEAGGRATDLEGRRAVDSGTFLATNGLLHETIRRRLLEE